ncbi:hypothetical protein AAF712_008558 [Marasmius tenuissimus]|uniref:Uncharacterized protein n=1 Tax=Marasmius tenuissimus TaxID=585030 RepID=A0ABR2ZS50_9AGAR
MFGEGGVTLIPVSYDERPHVLWCCPLIDDAAHHPCLGDGSETVEGTRSVPLTSDQWLQLEEQQRRREKKGKHAPRVANPKPSTVSERRRNQKNDEIDPGIRNEQLERGRIRARERKAKVDLRAMLSPPVGDDDSNDDDDMGSPLTEAPPSTLGSPTPEGTIPERSGINDDPDWNGIPQQLSNNIPLMASRCS